MDDSQSLALARQFLSKEVEVVFDRPLGSKHPKHGYAYEVNYGYVPGVMAPDGEDLDAYFLGGDQPLERAAGECIAIVHRLKDDDDKLVVAPHGVRMTSEEIERSVSFQEKWFEHEIVMAS